MKVKVKSYPGSTDAVDVELEGDDGYPKGWTVRTIPTGKVIGRVFKSSYTYSPPVYRGSPIVREHRRVESWSSARGSQKFQHYPTRREAIWQLVSRNREE
jgi:hypothetical protein